MKLVFAGTPEVALPSLEALIASRHEVVAVVTRPDAPAGRGRRLVASPVAGILWSQMGPSTTFFVGAGFAALSACGLLGYRLFMLLR